MRLTFRTCAFKLTSPLFSASFGFVFHNCGHMREPVLAQSSGLKNAELCGPSDETRDSLVPKRQTLQHGDQVLLLVLKRRFNGPISML